MRKKYKRAEESQITISELMLPSHSNFSGKIHGGHILNLMDQVAFACAAKHSEHYCVTASVNKVDFLCPIEVGELLIMKASVNYTGNTSMVIGIRVEAENVQTGIIKHCNSSYFVMVAKDDNSNKIKIPGLILDTKESIRRFSRSLKSQEDRKQEGITFHDQDFNVEDHVHLLANRNVKITYNL